jgi:hypothetical protein
MSNARRPPQPGNCRQRRRSTKMGNGNDIIEQHTFSSLPWQPWPILILCMAVLWLPALAADLGSVSVSESAWPAGDVSLNSGEAAEVIRIGVYGCTVNTPAGGCWRDRPELLYSIWLEHVSQRPILGRYRVEILDSPVPLTPSSNRTQLRIATQALLDAPGGPPMAIVLPVGNTVWDDSIMSQLESEQIIVLALSPLTTQFICGTSWQNQVGCKGPSTRRWKYANGLLNSGPQYFAAFLGLLRVESVRRLAIIQVTSFFYGEVASGIATAAAQYQMQITFQRSVTNQDGSIARVPPAVLDATVADLAALSQVDAPEVVFILAFNCAPWIASMRRINYLPKSIAAVRCVDNDDARLALGADLNYVNGPGQWSETITSSDYSESLETQPWAMYPAVLNGTRTPRGSAAQFADAYRRTYNLSSEFGPNYVDASFVACLVALEAAITLANSSSSVRVQEMLNTLFQPSFFGTISFNRFGFNEQHGFVTLQRDVAGSMQLIDPPIVATSRFIYPMPSWNERVYLSQLLDSSVERVFIALMLACIVVTALLCLYLHTHRRRQMLNAAVVCSFLSAGGANSRQLIPHRTHSGTGGHLSEDDFHAGSHSADRSCRRAATAVPQHSMVLCCSL